MSWEDPITYHLSWSFRMPRLFVDISSLARADWRNVELCTTPLSTCLSPAWSTNGSTRASVSVLPAPTPVNFFGASSVKGKVKPFRSHRRPTAWVISSAATMIMVITLHVHKGLFQFYIPVHFLEDPTIAGCGFRTSALLLHSEGKWRKWISASNRTTLVDIAQSTSETCQPTSISYAVDSWALLSQISQQKDSETSTRYTYLYNYQVILGWVRTVQCWLIYWIN